MIVLINRGLIEYIYFFHSDCHPHVHDYLAHVHTKPYGRQPARRRSKLARIVGKDQTEAALKRGGFFFW